jgi:hypothetical protein
VRIVLVPCADSGEGNPRGTKDGIDESISPRSRRPIVRAIIEFDRGYDLPRGSCHNQEVDMLLRNPGQSAPGRGAARISHDVSKSDLGDQQVLARKLPHQNDCQELFCR